jgi:hypothetical protein
VIDIKFSAHDELHYLYHKDSLHLIYVNITGSRLVSMFIKDITYTTKSALYFDLNIDIDSDRRIRNIHVYITST